MDHLLIHYGGAHHLWNFVFRRFGVSWVFPERVINLLAEWRNWLESTRRTFGIWFHCV